MTKIDPKTGVIVGYSGQVRWVHWDPELPWRRAWLGIDWLGWEKQREPVRDREKELFNTLAMWCHWWPLMSTLLLTKNWSLQNYKDNIQIPSALLSLSYHELLCCKWAGFWPFAEHLKLESWLKGDLWIAAKPEKQEGALLACRVCRINVERTLLMEKEIVESEFIIKLRPESPWFSFQTRCQFSPLI